ncbi:hypothetical protein ABZ876_32520 [Streptomyces sp. NPDC046931]|uniref:hypothetical protein n=1 Tax=Streptomyces sp. NPDC046931 TaxID=3154806 RepID=UPI0033C42BDC
MKLVVLFALGLSGAWRAWGSAGTVRRTDLMPLVRTSLVALSVLTLGAAAVLASDPADVPSVVRTVFGALR